MPRTHRRYLPLVLSADAIARLIDAAPDLRYRTILMTLYSTGLRRVDCAACVRSTLTKSA